MSAVIMTAEAVANKGHLASSHGCCTRAARECSVDSPETWTEAAVSAFGVRWGTPEDAR